ncbi:MAG TPA: hypothetical protein VG960_01995 [Caulobacteraceae bacterium]|nr:hypothetical protein [Caulobacteraceae bacterium]
MTFKRLLLASAVLAVAGCATRHRHYEEPRQVELGPIAGGVVGQAIARGSSVPDRVHGPVPLCRSDGRCPDGPGERDRRDYEGPPR